jgi:hypothetical protein
MLRCSGRVKRYAMGRLLTSYSRPEASWNKRFVAKASANVPLRVMYNFANLATLS